MEALSAASVARSLRRLNVSRQRRASTCFTATAHSPEARVPSLASRNRNSASSPHLSCSGRPCPALRLGDAPGTLRWLDWIGTLVGDLNFFFSNFTLLTSHFASCPPLLACAMAAGFAARILRLRASLRVVFWVGALFGDLSSSLSNFTLPTSHFASMPCAFGRHPGAAAVIRPIVHDRAAFGLQFFPCC
jgi:hypothetical protein